MKLETFYFHLVFCDKNSRSALLGRVVHHDTIHYDPEKEMPSQERFTKKSDADLENDVQNYKGGISGK